MIFRLDGRIEDTLALTPAIRGWYEVTGEKVCLNVLYPELFKNNPYVSEIQNESKSDIVIDFNLANWMFKLNPVCETFMEYVLGTIKSTCWKTLMYSDKQDIEWVNSFIPRGKIAIISLNKNLAGLKEFLEGKGYNVLNLRYDEVPSVNIFREIVNRASLYIGIDGDDTAIALTTDVPAIVCYTWRNPIYFTPFRRGIPFESISPKSEHCVYANGCLISNGYIEMGKIHGINCPLEQKMNCEKSIDLERIINSIDIIESRL